MRHGKHVPQGDGKREGKERKVSQVSHCLTVPLYQISNKNCNKKDNILINNDLDKIHNSIWDSGTVGHLGHFCKDFSNSYRFAYNWILQHFPPLLKRIIQLHDNAVSRDKMLIGTPDIVSGLIDNA